MTLFLARGLDLTLDVLSSGRRYHRTRAIPYPRRIRVRDVS